VKLPRWWYGLLFSASKGGVIGVDVVDAGSIQTKFLKLQSRENDWFKVNLSD
jgi:hypothetical protein